MPERDWLDSDSETESDGDDDAGSEGGTDGPGEAAERSQSAMSSVPLAGSMGKDDAGSCGVTQVKSGPADSLAIWSLS